MTGGDQYHMGEDDGKIHVFKSCDVSPHLEAAKRARDNSPERGMHDRREDRPIGYIPPVVVAEICKHYGCTVESPEFTQLAKRWLNANPAFKGVNANV